MYIHIGYFNLSCVSMLSCNLLRYIYLTALVRQLFFQLRIQIKNIINRYIIM